MDITYRDELWDIMVGNDDEKVRLQNLVKSCLLEINEIKMELMNLEKEKNLLENDERIEKLEKIKKEKEKEVSELKFNLKNLEDSLNDKYNVIKNQELKIEELGNFKDSFDDIKTALEQDLKQHNDKLKSALSAISEKDKKIKSLVSDIESYKEKVSDLENNLASKDNLLKLQREIDAKDSEIKALKDSSVDKYALKSLKKEIEGKEKRITELEDVQTSFEEVKSSFEDKISDKDKRINELEQIQNSFEDIRKSLEKDIEKHRAKEIEEINSKLKSALDKVTEKDSAIKSLTTELEENKREISRIKDINVFKTDYDALKEEIKVKEMKIQRLEEIKGLFSDLDKCYKNEGSQAGNIVDDSNTSKPIISANNNNNSNNKEIKKLKKDLKSCRSANKELESIKDNYRRLTSSPKKDLTSFQSQIYYLILDKPMNFQEIHSYIRKIAFKDISYKNIINIIRGLERKGYLEMEDPKNPQDTNWIKTKKK
ncbi:Chromosome partition protein Smc [Candidatus Methanobinarius endosymbioticus]|uniref:Chromosome partition protein Smc n=1 Tax=Candidatus Methanobinarius endosymbioticus TaxID=2006182 RepID=A0A366MFZ8_9EURY|nr:Chromosome partition protein Smc [Candidatus Methanobinarius endosymbioticus]